MGSLTGKAAVLKTAAPKAHAGSTPAPSATDTHADNLERVADRIAGHVLEFCRKLLAQSVSPTFRMGDLTAHVAKYERGIAPDSPGRILRNLKQQGRVGYELLSRRDSLYEIRWVR